MRDDTPGQAPETPPFPTPAEPPVTESSGAYLPIEPRGTAPPPEPPPESRWVRLRRSPAARWAAVGAGVLLLVLAAGWFTCAFRGCPDPESLAAWEPGGAPVIMDRNGEEFATLLPVQREIVPIDSLPEHVGQAFIAVEDRRFRSHGGVDIRRVGGALLANIRAGGVAEGGSTITMQLARNAFPDHLPASQRNMRRKIAEARVAMGIEDRFEKDEILGLYLNQIYFGNGATGIASASRHYFGVPPSELSVDQAALLAAMVKAPAHYDPRDDAEEALERRNLVLDLMLEADFLTAEEHAAARETELDVVPGARAADAGESLPAPWYLEAVRRALDDALGPDLYRTQVRVFTGLDPALQAAAEEALLAQLAAVESGRYGTFTGAPYDPDAPPDSAGAAYLQGAVVVLDANQGDVLAIVGGRNHRLSSFDHVFDARRQVGSAFKPFVYGAALAAGVPPSQPLDDTPLEIELRGQPTYRPSNYDGTFEGPMTAREALRRSRNVPTVRLAQQIGTDRVAEFAREAGIEGDIPEGPSMALGTVALSPMELARAYTTFAGLGQSVEPRLIQRVESADGRVLWEAGTERTERIDPGVAYVLNDMLADVIDGGTGGGARAAGFRGRGAGKTGTTQDGADAWFVGYTPELVGVVWMGFDQPAPILRNATGGLLAAPVWGRMMAEADRTGGEWEEPEGIVRSAAGCGDGTDLFLPGMDPPVCAEPLMDTLGLDSLGLDTLGLDRFGVDTFGVDTFDADTFGVDALPPVGASPGPDTTPRPDTARATPRPARPAPLPRPDTARPDTAPGPIPSPPPPPPDTVRRDTLAAAPSIARMVARTVARAAAGRPAPEPPARRSPGALPLPSSSPVPRTR